MNRTRQSLIGICLNFIVMLAFLVLQVPGAAFADTREGEDEAPKDISVLNLAKAANAPNVARAAIERQRTYKMAFSTATTLEKIAAFEKSYANSDPDNLIPKLEPLKLQLEAKQYQERFGAAKSSSELQSFIAAYASNDPDTLIPQAKKRLTAALKIEQVEQAKALKIEQVEQAKADRVRAETEKLLELERLATPIVNCNQLTAGAYKAIQQEKEIAAVSGYENKQILRQAGEYIVTCRNFLPSAYQAYRKAGGTKSVNELR